jgi:hypothetical protein
MAVVSPKKFRELKFFCDLLNELSCWERAGAKQLASFGLPAIMSRV